MLNGAAACCNTDVGLDFEGGLQIGDSVADVRVTPRRRRRASDDKTGGGFLKQVETAIQKAVHPDTPVTSDGGAGGGNLDGGSSYASSAQVIPFPVVSPYRPLTATRVPIEGLTAFPKSGYYFNGEPVNDFNVDGDDPNDKVPLGHESLGFIDPMRGMPDGIGLARDRSYSPLGMQWEGVIGQITQTIPGIISSVKGKPYYDPSGNLNPQLYGKPGGTYEAPGGGQAPQGYYYDERGTLQQIGGAVGGAVGGIGQSLSDFVTRNPLLVLGGGLAVVLLFMKPPSRR